MYASLNRHSLVKLLKLYSFEGEGKKGGMWAFQKKQTEAHSVCFVAAGDCGDCVVLMGGTRKTWGALSIRGCSENGAIRL